MEKDLSTALLLDQYGALLPERQLKCLKCYYEEDLSLSEISENEGITRQGVRDNIKRGEAFLIQCEQKLGLAGRLREMEKHLDAACILIDEGKPGNAKQELLTVKNLL
ncbi:MAG: hypothetical protein IKS19_05235 [Clostridia bacterium]|nr:hypothetical protein [Clostridia bacterium]